MHPLAGLQVCAVLDIPVEEDVLRAAEKKTAGAGASGPGSDTAMEEDASVDVSAGHSGLLLCTGTPPVLSDSLGSKAWHSCNEPLAQFVLVATGLHACKSPSMVP